MVFFLTCWLQVKVVSNEKEKKELDKHWWGTLKIHTCVSLVGSLRGSIHFPVWCVSISVQPRKQTRWCLKQGIECRASWYCWDAKWENWSTPEIVRSEIPLLKGRRWCYWSPGAGTTLWKLEPRSYCGRGILGELPWLHPALHTPIFPTLL